jgi:hypothetical protein
MDNRFRPFDAKDPSQDVLATRRRFAQIGGATLIGTALFGTSSAALAAAAPRPSPQSVGGADVGSINGGIKPIYVARPGSRDPVEHSVADTLFWGDQMMEHALFFVMLMPGEENAVPRGQAERFQKSFADHLSRLRGGRLDRGSYQAFNNATIELVRPLAEYKRAMSAAQTSGRYRTLVWTTFFDHTLLEAEWFASRLAQLNRGETAYRRAEVVAFWSRVMDEHSQFIAHLLDPAEVALINKANGASDTFRRFRSRPPQVGRGADPVLAAAESIIDFKTAASQGIQAGQIKSIINPALADHVRREAIRFRDELARAA